MHRGLRAPLSPNEKSTLRSVAHGTELQASLQPDVPRLHQLALVEWQGKRLAITPLGRQRLEAIRALGDRQPQDTSLREDRGAVPASKRRAKPTKAALSFNEDDQLPPSRAADLAKLEAEFHKLITGGLVGKIMKE